MLTAIVLAAGASRRLGRPKQLLSAGAEPLVVRAIGLGQAAAHGRVLVVVGAGRLRVRSVLRRRGIDAAIVCNPRWHNGLASSLGTGLGRVDRRARGALILLVDQAWLKPADIERLVRHWRRHPNRPAAASFEGRVGAPAIIPRRLFRTAQRLEGDTGARQLLRQFGELTAVAMPAAAFDVDTAEDAAALGRQRPGRR